DEGVFVVVIGANTLFEDTAKHFPEFEICRVIVFLHGGEIVEDTAHEPGADLRNMAVLLQSVVYLYRAGNSCSLENRVNCSHFTTCVRGLCHGITSLFLPTDVPGTPLALRHAA